MAVEWFEAPVTSGQHSQLAGYDHYWFRIDGRPSVLITYLQGGGLSAESGTLLAVQHSAADHHPLLPGRLLRLAGALDWRPAAPPEAEPPGAA
jgi:hypothetical protein